MQDNLYLRNVRSALSICSQVNIFFHSMLVSCVSQQKK
jgi:hypothetical protein